MRRLIPLSIVVVGMLAWPLQVSAAVAGAVRAAQERPAVDVVEVEGVIDRAMANYLRDALLEAEAEGHTVVIQLSTSGALDGETGHELARTVAELRVPVLVWVGVPGATAQGAGAEIALASSLPTVSPGSGIGPLNPASLRTDDPASSQQIAEVQAWAASRDRTVPEPLLDGTLTAQQALDAGVIPELEPDAPTPGSVIEFLKQADGMTVETGAGPVVLRTAPSASPEEGAGVSLLYRELGAWSGILHAVSVPAAVWLLLVLAFAGLAFELTQPGFGFAGISGLIALGFALYGMWSVPPSWLGLALFLAGTALLIADVQLRRLGKLTALGMGGFVGGSFLLYLDVAPAIRIPAWLIVSVAVLTFLYYGYGLTIAQQSYQRIVSTQQGLVGLTGETRNDLDPEGAVHVKGTLWRAKSVGESIPAGTRVRVRGVEGMVLRVEAEPEVD